jgi:hypothetical protein
MASDQYWARHLASLEKHFREVTVPYTGMLAGVGATHALEMIVGGKPEKARDYLNDLVPRLKSELADRRWMLGRSEYEGKEMMKAVAKGTHAAVWLQTGRFDPDLAKAARAWGEEMDRHWGGRMTGPNLLDRMLESIECGDPDAAVRLYEKQELNPLPLPPRDLRFTRNARSVLYFCLRTGKDSSVREFRDQAMRKFLAAATQWEKGIHPLPYLGLLDVARIVFAAAGLEGSPTSVETVAAQIR